MSKVEYLRPMGELPYYAVYDDKGRRIGRITDITEQGVIAWKWREGAQKSAFSGATAKDDAIHWIETGELRPLSLK